MADSKEDIASQALARLGEPAISSFDEDTDAAEKVKQLYESTILGLLSSYNWQWATTRAVLAVDGAKTPTNEWTRAFILPTQKTELVGQPLTVWNTTNLNARAFFEYEIENKWLFTNAETIVIEYIERKDEGAWPGYFEVLAREALAAALALPITENQTKEEWHTAKAYGSPSEQGRGGMYKRAVEADEVSRPTPSLLDDSDPMATTRFGGRNSLGWW